VRKRQGIKPTVISESKREGKGYGICGWGDSKNKGEKINLLYSTFRKNPYPTQVDVVN